MKTITTKAIFGSSPRRIAKEANKAEAQGLILVTVVRRGVWLGTVLVLRQA